VLILAGLLIVALLGLRRRRPDVVTGAALALVLSGAVVVGTASLPGLLLLRDYALRWTSPAGMFIWLVLAWSLAVPLRATRWGVVDRLTLAAVRRRAFASLIALTITATLAVVVATGAESDPDRWAWRPARAVASRLGARLPSQHTVLVRASSLTTYAFQTAIIYRLRRQGYHVVAPSGALAFDLSQRLGSYYSAHRRPDDVLLVDVSNKPLQHCGRVIAHVPLHGPTGGGAFSGPVNEPPPTSVTVTVLPAPKEQVAAACPPAARASTSGPTINQLRVVPG
jgi:hypothetical protein